jgi:hypothetical protein
MTNKEIAQQYAKMMFDLTSDDGVWLSTNFHDVPKNDRSNVLAVYQNIFPRVVYDKNTGAVYCYKKAEAV